MDAEVGAKPTGMGRAAYPDSPTAPLPEPPERDVLAALARQVDESPNQPAVDDGAVVLSYRDLWARAGRLAEHLAAAGVASEDRVVIVGPRSAAWVVGFLGALRAGAVAVPVSTVFPPQRCAKMALESGAGHAIVVGDEPDWAGSLRTISIRADATPRITDLPRASPAPQGEHATIYFTSGSTGPPKAVLGTHVGLASASAAWSRTTFALSTTDRISLVTNIGFVGTLRSVFGTLTSGATLCIAPDLLLPEQAIAWVAEARCTVLTTTATTVRTWLAERDPDTPRPTLRWTFFGGEPLPDTLVQAWRAVIAGSGRVANFWGATETGGARAWYEVPDPPHPGIQPLLHPLTGTQLLIFDEGGAALCDVDQPGELAVRARDLPVGYANDPEATARCFVANPFTHRHDDRIVLSGDRAIRRADGLIEILGRADDQVKLGGLRIDSGEVAGVLRAHPDVREAHVLPHLAADDTMELLAFVVLDGSRPVDLAMLRDDLRRRCAQALPLKAVPRRFEILERLPMNAVGKLDRRALLALVDEPAARLDPRPDPTLALPEPPDATLLDEIEQHVLDRPDHVALDDGITTATFDELWSRAGALAGRLAGTGVTTGTPVLVWGPRSSAFATAMLAVLRAGGVVVPCATMLPDARCATMARELGATHAIVIGQTPDWARDLTRLEIDGDAVPRHDGPVATPAAPGPHAYVFFTSGTTGTPKAVLGRHASLAEYLRWWRDAFAVTRDDRVSMATSTAFDVTLRNVFGPLVAGATVCVAPDGLLPEDGLAWLAAAQVSVLHVTPSLAASWLDEAGTSAPHNSALHNSALHNSALRWTLFAGEMLTDTLASRWRAAQPGAMGNMYGPTETTMSRCLYVVPERPSVGPQPVGTPLPGSQTLVVDATGALCEIGVPGEVLIRTRAGTAGYANNVAEQAFRFVPNPFTDDPDDIVYRTGDRGIYLPDGHLQLVGRVDDQVKIGGVRVEPAEVTAVLVRHDDVRAVHVQARLAPDRDPELVAFVVSDVPPTERTACVARLRRHCGGLLAPAAMPRRFEFVDRLPMTTNGKVDRAALLALLDAPSPLDITPEFDLDAPSPLDITPEFDLDALVGVWREALRRDDINAETNFFDMGGSSIQAARLFAAIERRTGVRLGLAVLFDAPTVRALAHELRDARSVRIDETTAVGEVDARTTLAASRDEALLVTLRAGDVSRRTPLYCVHPAGGQLFAYAALLPELPVDQPVIGIREYGWGDPTRRLPTIEAYAARYVDEVQRHQPTGAIALAGYSLGGLLAYEMARLFAASGRRVEVVLLLDAVPAAAADKRAHQVESSLSKLRRRLARDGATGVARGIGRLVRRRWQRWYQHPAEARRAQRALRAATRAGVEPDLLLLGLLSEHFGHGLRLAYRPERYDGRVVHCHATGVDPDFPLGDYRYRWRRVVDDLTMVEVPGNHSREGSMFTPPHVEVLGARVSEVLDTILKGDR